MCKAVDKESYRQPLILGSISLNFSQLLARLMQIEPGKFGIPSIYGQCELVRETLQISHEESQFRQCISFLYWSQCLRSKRKQGQRYQHTKFPRLHRFF